MSKIEVDAIVPQSGTTLTVGEAGDTVDISNATLSANLNANNLTSGTIPDARFPATLPAVDGSNLTNIQIAGGYTACDAITVTNTDTFALTAGGSPVSPESANNCIVSLNGVIQAPGTSYTISGSNIVFASALSAGSDVIDFITVLGTALNVGTVSDGTIGLAKLSATGTKDATTFLRGDNTFASAGESNVPAFSVYRSSDQTLSDNVYTKVQFNTENYDTDSAYDNSTNYRFTVPSGKDGKYFFYFRGWFYNNEISQYGVQFRKNGSEVATKYIYSGNTGSSIGTIEYFAYDISATFDLSATDYIEVYIKADATDGASTTFSGGSEYNEFTGFKITE